MRITSFCASVSFWAGGAALFAAVLWTVVSTTEYGPEEMARFGDDVDHPDGDQTLRALAARRGIRERYEAWGRTGREPGRPLLWMHAPSVGEGLQARPVLQLARARRPALQLAYTHFSPSAGGFASALKVDFRDETSPAVATEFVGTSISSGGDGTDMPQQMTAVLAESASLFSSVRK